MFKLKMLQLESFQVNTHHKINTHMFSSTSSKSTFQHIKFWMQFKKNVNPENSTILEIVSYKNLVHFFPFLLNIESRWQA